MAQGEGPADACLLLVCGLPGCGKTSFCRELLDRAAREPELLGPAAWHHVCYDAVEAELRAPGGGFEPAAWQAARRRCGELVQERLDARAGAPGGRAVLVLDDNMYYRSMRKHWYHFARERCCTYRQLFLRAPEDVCLERNRQRDAASRVPDFSIRHMAAAFEWPREEGGSWEARAPVTTSLEADGESTASQVESFLSRWRRSGPDAPDFWEALPPEEPAEAAPEAQSDAHVCDLALRRVVAQALATAPPELGKAKTVLAKRWGQRKGDLVRQFTAEVKAGGTAGRSPGGLINELEAAFLQSCVADVRQLLAESPPVA